jgi:endonuclease/exonuclease/phosphatase family metal-dependent hydrolase
MPDSIHLAAWNINHRTGRKSIPPDTLHAIAALDLDVLVLTEFVDGPHHANFKESLKDIGFSSLAISVKAPQQNQVLIAARTPLADDGLLPLPGHTEAATTNWLHRRLPDLRLEIVGFRAPVYLYNDDRVGYWQQVESIVRSARERPVVFLGDFNLDPHADTRPFAQVFPRLTRDGFTLANPKGDWSCQTGNGGSTRIDHALATPAVPIQDARYLYKTGRHLLAGPANGHGPALSDHALLSIRVTTPRATARPDQPVRLT